MRLSIFYVLALSCVFLTPSCDCGGDDTCTIDADCDDGSACTTGTCNIDGVCEYEDVVCDDGVFCNGAETCDPNAGCQAAAAPLDPDDGIDCTMDSCDEDNDVIVNEPDHGFCSNGEFCDGDEVCSTTNGCEAGPARTGDDGIGCTDDSCDEVNDVIINTPNDGLCDNGIFCDGDEVCDPMNDCQAALEPRDIDDGVSCTEDFCDEGTDTITHTPMDSLCDDGLFCTGVETCDAVNDCQGGTPPSIDDGVGCTDDLCDEVNDTIVHLGNDANCNNNLFCDGVETCDPINDCQAGMPPVVDDGVPCTDDSCDEVNDVAVNTPNDANCQNGLFCDGTEVCDAVADCQPGTPVAIDDGIACTDDSCDETNDVVVNAVNDGNCNDNDGCTLDTCDAANDCQFAQDIACSSCNAMLYDNGAFDSVNGIRPFGGPPDWTNDGVVDEFTLVAPDTEFCSIKFNMLETLSNGDITDVRIRIFPAPAGIAALGDFNLATPVFDQTYDVASGTLVMTDTGADAFGFDHVDYEAIGTNADIGPGTFALHLSFPSNVNNGGFWSTAPTAGGTSDCAHTWGPNVALTDLCISNGPEFENLAFELRKSTIVPFDYAAAPSLAIVDNATVSDTNTVPAGDPSCTITDIHADVDINHTWAGDVTVSLSHDLDGVSLDLMNDDLNGIGNVDLLGLYTFDDDAGAPFDPVNVGGASVADGGSLLGTFAGRDTKSNWTMSVNDDATSDQGTLNSWRIYGQCAQ